MREMRKGDYAAVPGYGICTVVSIGHPAIPNADPGTSYYTLCPEHDSSCLYIPVNADEACIRPIISKDEALALIGSIPGVKLCSGSDKFRIVRYREAIGIGTPDALLPLIMEIYQRNSVSISKGKGIKLPAEAHIFKEAEELFNDEMAHALGCAPSEIPRLIEEMVSTAESGSR